LCARIATPSQFVDLKGNFSIAQKQGMKKIFLPISSEQILWIRMCATSLPCGKGLDSKGINGSAQNAGSGASLPLLREKSGFRTASGVPDRLLHIFCGQDCVQYADCDLNCLIQWPILPLPKFSAQGFYPPQAVSTSPKSLLLHTFCG
jgi:hypothetical protein